MDSHLIINYLREQEQLKLIFAKNDILMCALEGLIGYTIDISEHVNLLERILESGVLDESIEKDLIEKHYDLTSTEDLRVPESDQIESLCERIRSLNSYITEKDVILDASISNKFQNSINLTLEQIIELMLEWTNSMEYIGGNVLNEVIEEFRRIEKEKIPLIEELEKEVLPIKNLANKLLQIEAIEKDWWYQLTEISDESVYTNNFHAYHGSRKNELMESYAAKFNLEQLNEIEEFFDLIWDKLSIN